MKKFYDVHVFFSREDGYSIPIKIETEVPMDDEDVINACIDMDLFNEDGDQYMVNYVMELDESEYNLMKK